MVHALNQPPVVCLQRETGSGAGHDDGASDVTDGEVEDGVLLGDAPAAVLSRVRVRKFAAIELTCNCMGPPWLCRLTACKWRPAMRVARPAAVMCRVVAQNGCCIMLSNKPSARLLNYTRARVGAQAGHGCWHLREQAADQPLGHRRDA